MSIRILTFSLLIFSQPLLASSSCLPKSQKIFCRFLRCVDGTSWESEKIKDPFHVIKKDDSFIYNTILMPINDGKGSFLALNKDKMITYSFSEKTKVGLKCSDDGDYASLKLQGVCQSRLPFGLGCLLSEPKSIALSPYSIRYWDGKRVEFLCLNKSNNKSVSLELNQSAEPVQNILRYSKSVLKNKMKQLTRAIKADKKNMDFEKILKVIKNAETPTEIGDCRHFLDGNTLNLIQEEIIKQSNHP